MRFHRDPLLRDAWREGRLEVAQQAAAQVPDPARVAWASTLAATALPGLAARSDLRATVERVAALDVGTAAGARGLFQEVRGLRLALDDAAADEDALLALAELACKVTYDATRPAAPFHARSDVALVQAAAGVARRLPGLEDALWDAVCRRPRAGT